MSKDNVIDFLKNESVCEQELALWLLQLESKIIPSKISDTNEFQEFSTPPRLSWEDVLDLAKIQYHINTNQSHHILFIRPGHKELPKHTHDYFEMIYVLSGTSTHLINGNLETLREGDFCILPPSSLHIQSTDVGSLTAELLVLPSFFTSMCAGLLEKPDSLGSFLTDSIYVKNDDLYLVVHTGQSPLIREKVLELGQEILLDDTYSNRIACGLLMVLLITLIRNYPSNLQTAPVRNVHHEILSIMQKEYATITLASLAEYMHYSVPYCSRYIKKLFNQNFSSLLRGIRLQVAKADLRNTNLSVNQISKKVGYESPENFIRAFKNQCHLTPKQYREQYKIE